ncbi:methyl-accepting chemotaxis protein, partial [Rhizobium sp. L18]
AEELQTSIAFFKVDMAGGHRERAPVAKAVARSRPQAAPRKPATKTPANTVAGQQARVKGFALDMSMGGPDMADDEFRESA